MPPAGEMKLPRLEPEREGKPEPAALKSPSVFQIQIGGGYYAGGPRFDFHVRNFFAAEGVRIGRLWPAGSGKR